MIHQTLFMRAVITTIDNGLLVSFDGVLTVAHACTWLNCPALYGSYRIVSCRHLSKNLIVNNSPNYYDNTTVINIDIFTHIWWIITSYIGTLFFGGWFKLKQPATKKHGNSPVFSPLGSHVFLFLRHGRSSNFWTQMRVAVWKSMSFWCLVFRRERCRWSWRWNN